MKVLTDRVRRIVLLAVALVCLLIGLLTVWTPLPTGIPLIALAIVILATVSPTARRLLRQARLRYGLVDRSMVVVETRAHRTLATMLKRTRPLQRKAGGKAALEAAGAALRSPRPDGPKPQD